MLVDANPATQTPQRVSISDDRFTAIDGNGKRATYNAVSNDEPPGFGAWSDYESYVTTESEGTSVESVEKLAEDGSNLSADELLWEMLQA